MKPPTEAQRALIVALPDAGGAEAWTLPIQTVNACVRRGWVRKEYAHPGGLHAYDRYSRTKEGRMAIWPEEKL